MWPHGSEPAFTLIPNFLITGIAAMLVGLAIIVWSIGYIHRKNGAIVLLLLFVLLLLVGGGVAQILFFPWICLVASRINKPLVWWRKKLPGTFLSRFGKAWSWSLVTGSTIMVFVLAIGITGFVPGVSDAEAVMSVMLVCLASELVILPFTFISGFAYDIAVGRRDQI